VELKGSCSFVAIVLHDGLINSRLYLLYSFHVVLDIVTNSGQFFSLVLDCLSGQSELCLNGCAVVEDGIVAKVFLHFQHFLDLFEIGSHLFEHIAEMCLGFSKQFLTLAVLAAQFL
jgi:hypothetical protein